MVAHLVGDGKPDLHRPKNLSKVGDSGGGNTILLLPKFSIGSSFWGDWFVLLLLFMVSFYRLHIFHKHL